MDSGKLIAVFIGGGIGSVLRFIISYFITRLFSDQFPYGTLTVNLLGCFCIGLLLALFSTKIENPDLKLFFTTGMMGGLTTFSTFSFETVSLLKDEAYLKAILNITISLAGCLFLTFSAFKLSLLMFNR